MKQLIIVGAGGFGREVLSWALQNPECGQKWVVKGFINDIADALDGYGYEVPILSSIDDYEPDPEDLLVCAIGEPAGKKKVCQKLLAKGGVFTNLIHPTAHQGLHVQMGQGIVICPWVGLSVDIVLGDFVTLNGRCIIGHDVVIDEWATIGPNSTVAGYAHIGIEATVGMNAAVLPHTKVGEKAVVGAGSVAGKRVKPGQTVFGIPAVPIC